MIRRLAIILLMSAAGYAGQDHPTPRPPDPLQPGAKAFCHSGEPTKTSVHCECATSTEDFCSTEDPLPIICSKMCGHAKDCYCCNKGHNK